MSSGTVALEGGAEATLRSTRGSGCNASLHAAVGAPTAGLDVAVELVGAARADIEPSAAAADDAGRDEGVVAAGAARDAHLGRGGPCAALRGGAHRTLPRACRRTMNSPPRDSPAASGRHDAQRPSALTKQSKATVGS